MTGLLLIGPHGLPINALQHFIIPLRGEILLITRPGRPSNPLPLCIIFPEAPCRCRQSGDVPGIKQQNPPDVMRGEETQIAGFLNSTLLGESTAIRILTPFPNAEPASISSSSAFGPIAKIGQQAFGWAKPK